VTVSFFLSAEVGFNTKAHPHGTGSVDNNALRLGVDGHHCASVGLSSSQVYDSEVVGLAEITGRLELFGVLGQGDDHFAFDICIGRSDSQDPLDAEGSIDQLERGITADSHFEWDRGYHTTKSDGIQGELSVRHNCSPVHDNLRFESGGRNSVNY